MKNWITNFLVILFPPNFLLDNKIYKSFDLNQINNITQGPGVQKTSLVSFIKTNEIWYRLRWCGYLFNEEKNKKDLFILFFSNLIWKYIILFESKYLFVMFCIFMFFYTFCSLCLYTRNYIYYLSYFLSTKLNGCS